MSAGVTLCALAQRVKPAAAEPEPNSTREHKQMRTLRAKCAQALWYVQVAVFPLHRFIGVGGDQSIDASRNSDEA